MPTSYDVIDSSEPQNSKMEYVRYDTSSTERCNQVVSLNVVKILFFTCKFCELEKLKKHTFFPKLNTLGWTSLHDSIFVISNPTPKIRLKLLVIESQESQVLGE